MIPSRIRPASSSPFRNRTASPAITAFLYFAGAAFSVHFSRFAGGVAMIWVASAILAARLFVIRPREWPATIAACTVASVMATGFFGLGWAAALPLAVVNMGEAAAAALVVRSLARTCWSNETLELVAGYYIGLGLLIPCTTALLGAAAVVVTTGAGFEVNFYHWLIGHAVGLLSILPFAASLARARRYGERVVPPGSGMTSLLLCAVMALLTFAVFTQPIRPFMLAPLLFIMLAAVWSNITVAMSLPVILAVLGGVLTLYGKGPMGRLAFDPGDRLQVFQMYVAITVLCAMPVVVEQERRRRQIRRMARREAHWRQRSGAAGDLIAELAHAAATDPLTGLPNRRDFEGRLAKVSAGGRPACIAMIDIDHFKRINDRHGHQAGDEVLRAFGQIAPQTLRGTDMIARIGGEEFALLLQDTSPEQAELICARLCQKVADTRIETCAGPLRITVSCGIANLAGDGEAALAEADKALYSAKAAGRARPAVAA